jgi:small-conductance mechanosensitive channel
MLALPWEVLSMKAFIHFLFTCLLLFALISGRAGTCAETDSLSFPASPPGVAEIIPRLAELKQQSADLVTQLERLQETESFLTPLKDAREQADILIPATTNLSDPSNWNFDRLLDTRSQLVEQKDKLGTLLDGISVRLQTLDSLREHWQNQQVFWQQWQESLPEDVLKTQREAFKQAVEESQKAQQRIVAAGEPLITLQGEVTQLQEQTLNLLALVDNTLQTMRGETFQKTARSFTSPRFYRQFNPTLMDEVKKGVESIAGLDSDFFRSQGWLVGVQLFMAILLAGFVFHKTRRAEASEEWQFIIRHPMATALFVSTIVCSPFYSAPPALWRWLLALLAAFSSAVLITGLLDDPRKKLMIYVLACIFVVTLALQIIALPLPLYRLYLAALSLLGIPFLLVLAALHRKVPGRRKDFFIPALRLGAVILFCSFVAQWLGYSTLSSRLVESSMNTVFLGLLTWMTLHLGSGGLQYLLNLPILRRRRFVFRFGRELENRLRRLLVTFIVGCAALYLLEIWRIFPSAGQAWRTILQLEFALGQKTIAIKLVLMAIVTFYAAVQGSWILGALLETEFFPRRPLDRGVHDSILKLLHYVVITLGFLLSLSLLGFELKNFVVLAGALGIGIGFGLQHIVNNFVSGLLLLFERPVKVGDMIMIESEWCTVRKIGLRATTVETFDQSEIIVPNSDLISQKVTNLTLSSEQSRVVVQVGAAYGSNVQKVLELLTACAAEHPRVLKDPPPSPLFVAFGESSLNFELRAWVAKTDYRFQVKSDLLSSIDNKFREAGIEIPFPQRDLHLRSLDITTLKELFDEHSVKDTERH